MPLNLDRLKKIPLFKNVDFEDPRSKKRLAMVFGAAALMLMVIIANIAMSGEKAAPATASNDVFLELPEGRDNDILNEEDMVAVRQRSTPGNKDLFAEAKSLNADDPLGFLNEEEKAARIAENSDTRMTPADPLKDIFSSDNSGDKKEKAMSMFGLSNDGKGKETPPQGAVVDALDALASAPDKARDAVKEGTSSRMTPAGKRPSREEAEARENSENRKAKSAGTQPRGGRTLADAERQRRDGDAYGVQDDPSRQQYGQEEQPRAVRRSGGISSLAGDWGTIEGISSLDNESVYVTQDDDHPYKVMFTRDQKLKSGDRITIRLLEDMAVDGVLIPKNTHLSATCQIGERLQITVSNIEMNGRIYALNYSAYDNDGSQGLYCPISGATKTSDQGKSIATQTASTLLSSAASIAGAAMGSGALGGMLGNMTNIGASAVASRNGSVTATVNSGYTFYLLKN